MRRGQNERNGIKDEWCKHMGLTAAQFNHLKMIFIQKRVWEIMWNQISWIGIYQQAFSRAMLKDNMKLKNYLIKIALYSAAEKYSYEALEKDIFIGGRRGEGGADGVVTRVLKARLEKMKCKYQRPQVGEGLNISLTGAEELECERMAWQYLANETIKPD
jgi:hypothetical protein